MKFLKVFFVAVTGIFFIGSAAAMNMNERRAQPVIIEMKNEHSCSSRCFAPEARAIVCEPRAIKSQRLIGCLAQCVIACFR